MIKRLLRRLELQGKLTALCARHVFEALMQHESQWEKDISSRYKLASLFFHYIPVSGEAPSVEPEAKDSDRVWDPISRPRNPPAITAVTGCRSHFCFRLAGHNRLALRELSCRCASCFAHNWDDCTQKNEVGEWSTILMESVPSRSVYTTRRKVRSQRELISEERQKMAKECLAREYVSLESKNDKEGFPFWVARVTKPAWQHVGAATRTEHGVKLTRGGWYMEVQWLERFPATSETMFQEWMQAPWVVDVEGVVAREVQVSCTTSLMGRVWIAGPVRRGMKAAALFRVKREEVTRLTKAAEVRLDLL